ncbi:hypothetical protein BCR33DRAFT_77586 [Rhizoclosmatium globosum]|uniref:Uncharacterized protein n=1 Tax=Rhizoclosmatium globosum TaxID=329046 RepID=A0A1Y2CL38_9FUNG|nr:hypothetical protein BCR33DRAFT_77586 [Rhizoclosmatium globosum]|eukprot:ORY47728.1 hypothetical protein BCR33DRAFT_77586 [Rhizoclosmatium globosum]
MTTSSPSPSKKTKQTTLFRFMAKAGQTTSPPSSASSSSSSTVQAPPTKATATKRPATNSEPEPESQNNNDNNDNDDSFAEIDAALAVADHQISNNVDDAAPPQKRFKVETVEDVEPADIINVADVKEEMKPEPISEKVAAESTQKKVHPMFAKKMQPAAAASSSSVKCVPAESASVKNGSCVLAW